jgi:hypothetical protein
LIGRNSCTDVQCHSTVDDSWGKNPAQMGIENGACGSLCDLDRLKAHVSERMVGPKMSLRPCQIKILDQFYFQFDLNFPN